MSSRPKRTAKQKADPDYVYNVPMEKMTKKALKAKKQSTMKAMKEEIFCDFGNSWKKLSELDHPTGDMEDRYSDNDVIDEQFYTHRPKEWEKAITCHLQLKFSNGEIPNAPETVDKNNDPQIKVKGDRNKNILAIKIYENGTVLIQGTDFLPFCRNDFRLIFNQLEMRGNQEGIKERIPTTGQICSGEDNILLEDLRSQITEQIHEDHEDKEEWIDINKLSVILPPVSDTISDSITDDVGDGIKVGSSDATASEEDTEMQKICEELSDNGELRVKLPPIDDTEKAQMSKCLIETKMELIKTKKENRDLQRRIKDLKYQIEAMVACSEGQGDEIICLRQAKNQDKLALKTAEETVSSLTACCELQDAEIKKLEKDAKSQRGQFERQKKEIKRLTCEKDALIMKNQYLHPTNQERVTVLPQPLYSRVASGEETAVAPGLRATAPPFTPADQPTASTTGETSTAAVPGAASVPAPGTGAASELAAPATGDSTLTELESMPEEREGALLQPINPLVSNRSQRKENEKSYLHIIGDAVVRGLGPKVQDYDINGQVTVRSGQTYKEASDHIASDISAAPDGSTLILGFGTTDLNRPKIRESKDYIERLINNINNTDSRVRVGLLKIPPQLNSRRNAHAKDLNKLLVQKCRFSHQVELIDAKLSFDDMGKDGKFCNNSGKEKLATAIRRFTRTERDIYARI